MKVSTEIELDLRTGDGDEPWVTATPEMMTRIIEPEVQAFEQWFVTLGQQSLSGYEKSILRTYLAWKLRG